MTSHSKGLFLVLALTAVLIWPVTKLGFVLHDDHYDILANSNLNPFNETALKKIWSEADYSGVYIPLHYTFLGILADLSRWWSGTDQGAPLGPGVFHAASALLHLANTLLVYKLLHRLLSRGSGGYADHRPQFAVLGALIFAAHPAQVESYSRAGNLSVTLGGFWALLALGSFLRSGDCGRRPSLWQTGAFVLFLCGMLTRPTVAALPLMVFFLAWTEGSKSARSLSIILFPWLVAGGMYSVLTFWLQSGALPSDVAISWWLRPIVAADSVLWYLAQTIWPAKLSIDHGRVASVVLTRASTWLSVVGAAAMCAASMFFLRARARLPAAGFLAFCCMLLPVCGLVPSHTRDGLCIVYDRHLYVPMFAAAISVSALLARANRGTSFAAGVSAVCVLGLLSRQYQQVWRDSVSLFAHTISVNPKSWYAHGQLGAALLLSGRPEASVPFLARACELNKDHVDARVNLGTALLNTNRDEEAETVLREALSLAPNHENGRNDLTIALLRREDWTGAEAEARRVLAVNPAQPVATEHLAMALAGQEKWDEAVEAALKGVKLSPTMAAAWKWLSEILTKAGRGADAMKALRQACELAPERDDWREMLESKAMERKPAPAHPTPPLPE